MNFLVDERLNEKQLSRLKDHVYSSSGKSILDHKVDQRVHIDNRLKNNSTFSELLRSAPKFRPFQGSYQLILKIRATESGKFVVLSKVYI